MIPRDRFDIGSLKLVKTYKSGAAFLVQNDEHYAVLKSENAMTGKKIRTETDYWVDNLNRQSPASANARREFVNRFGAEPSAKASIAMMAEIFGYVTGDLGGVYVLNRQEEALLDQWLRIQLFNDRGVLDPTFKATRGAAQGALVDPKDFVWYIMEAYSLLYSLEVNSIREPAENEGQRIARTSIRQLLRNNPGYYEQLGRIVAVDIFNANSDRWYFDDDTCSWQLPNVFVTFDGQRFRFIGVDFFDTLAGACYFGPPWDAMKEKLARNINTRYLLRCFEALHPRNEELRTRMSERLLAALGSATDLETNSKEAKESFRAGMNMGCQRMKEFYLNGIQSGAYTQWPSGLVSRFAAAFGTTAIPR